MLMLKLRFENVFISIMGICFYREGLKFLKMLCVWINVCEEYFEMYIFLFFLCDRGWVFLECRYIYMVFVSEYCYVCMCIVLFGCV